MKANEFVKKHGLARTKYWIKEFTEINKLPDEMINLEFLNDLKRLVKAWELVQKQGGLISARKYITFLQSSVDIGLYHGLDNVDYKTEITLMKQAIADVESCGGGHESD